MSTPTIDQRCDAQEHAHCFYKQNDCTNRHLLTADELREVLVENEELRKEISITRQIKHDLSTAFKTGDALATKLHYAKYAIADLRERALLSELVRADQALATVGVGKKSPVRVNLNTCIKET